MDAAGAKGVAVGRTPEGKAVMVKGAVPGDVVDVAVGKSKSKYIEGTVAQLIEPSPYRVEPRCIHFGVCGGCKWQNVDYSWQLKFKMDEVVNNIKRIGGVTGFEVQAILPAPEEYFYRNKMEFSFSDARWLTGEEIGDAAEIADKNALGFHIPGMWSKILDLKECWLQEAPSNSIRLFVRGTALSLGLTFYDVKEHRGDLRSLMLRQNHLGEWMVFFQLGVELNDNLRALFDAVLANYPQIISLQYAVNTKANDSIYDLEVNVYHGADHLVEEMDGLKFKIGVKSFFQTNYRQAVNLYQKTLEFAGLTGNEVVYDLYTGTGTIAQFLARKAGRVIGLESVPEAIAAAKEHALLNGLTNCEFFCGDMKDIFNDAFTAGYPSPDVIVTDPPRDGMHQKVVEQILRLSPQKIVYVSCNSATQARDISLLKEQYQLIKILPVDMFPQTHHVENIALLQKR